MSSLILNDVFLHHLGVHFASDEEGGGGVKLRRQKSRTRIPLDWQKVIITILLGPKVLYEPWFLY